MKKLFLGAFFLLVGWTVSIAPAQAQGYTGMVSFGDSLSDLGNTVAKLSLFGEPFVREKTGYNANFYYNGRFSDGPVWSERLNDQLGFGTMLRNNGNDILTGSNFAWAGSTSGTGSTYFLLPNLRTQVDFYTSQISSNPLLPDPATTLFTVWSGGNDVINLVSSGTPVTPGEVASNISISITNLYNAGGRTFLVPNLPPLGFKPDFVFDPPKKLAANDFVDSYNLLLANALDTLSANLPGSHIIGLDIHALFVDITDHPSAFGLQNVTEPAYTPFLGSDPPAPFGSVVGNPEAYLYWDNSHGTTAVNTVIANLAYQAVVPEPSTWVLLLISAVAAVSLAGRHQLKPRARK